MDQGSLPDLDSRERVEQLVEAFYEKVLADPLLAPIFLDVARIDLAVHLPHIKSYWCKLLLGEHGYSRHTMNIHRQLHSRQPLSDAEFQRWLSLFLTTVDSHYIGPQAQRAKRVSQAIAANMRRALDVTH
jgi:hemoglobin